jgi:hypothetical protein
MTNKEYIQEELKELINEDFNRILRIASEMNKQRKGDEQNANFRGL